MTKTSKKSHHTKHKKHTSHEKKEESLIEDGLKAIYGSKDEVDFSTLERKRNWLTNLLVTVIISLGLIAGIGWGGFLLYNKYALSPIEETFVMNIETSDELVSGEPTEIIISYKNPNTVPITALELDVRIPDTFIVTNISPSPTDQEQLIWSIGNLSSGSDGLIIIEGIWIAETPSSTPVQVLANYRPTNFNSDFQDIATKYISTIDSTFEISFDGPQEVVPGETAEYTAQVTNSSKETIENVLVEIALPDGFFLDESEPEIESGGPAEWLFETFESGEEKEITFSGSFAADTNGFQYFTTEVRVQANNRELVQETKEEFTSVLSSDLALSLFAEGTTEEATVAPGENIRLTLTYENTGETDIEGVDLLLDFSSEEKLPINWNEAELDGGTITAEGIVWNERKTQILQPGDRELINLIIPIVDALNSTHSDTFSVIAHASHENISVKSSPLNIAINSEAQLHSSARYFTDDGEPIGNGPIPPSVGETTTYRIYWSITNSLHDLEDATITATLTPNVTWGNSSETQLGTMSYDPVTDTVEWDISAVSASVTKLQANFTVSITPDEDDIDEFMILLSEANLRAIDTETRDTLQSKADQLTTELLGDEYADGKGIIVE